MLSAFSVFTHQYAFSVQCIYTPVCFQLSVHLNTSMLSAFSAFKHQYAFSVQCIYTPVCFQRSMYLHTSMLSAFNAFTHQYAFIITMAGLHQVHDSKYMPIMCTFNLFKKCFFCRFQRTSTGIELSNIRCP